jgi:hypothetical protein
MSKVCDVNTDALQHRSPNSKKVTGREINYYYYYYYYYIND